MGVMSHSSDQVTSSVNTSIPPPPPLHPGVDSGVAAPSTGPGRPCAASPKLSIPSTKNYPGIYGFRLTLKSTDRSKETKSTRWTFSKPLNRIYCRMGVAVPITFRCSSSPPPDCVVRAMVVYTDSEHVQEIVARCPTHAQTKDDAFPHPLHLLRADDSRAVYSDVDRNFGRHAVDVPWREPQLGAEETSYIYKFMCLSTCVGGIHRRSTEIVFTLECVATHETLARATASFRVCSCPGRDRRRDEDILAKASNPSQSEEAGKRIDNGICVKTKKRPLSLDVLEDRSKRVSASRSFSRPLPSSTLLPSLPPPHPYSLHPHLPTHPPPPGLYTVSTRHWSDYEILFRVKMALELARAATEETKGAVMVKTESEVSHSVTPPLPPTSRHYSAPSSLSHPFLTPPSTTTTSTPPYNGIGSPSSLVSDSFRSGFPTDSTMNFNVMEQHPPPQLQQQQLSSGGGMFHYLPDEPLHIDEDPKFDPSINVPDFLEIFGPNGGPICSEGARRQESKCADPLRRPETTRRPREVAGSARPLGFERRNLRVEMVAERVSKTAADTTTITSKSSSPLEKQARITPPLQRSASPQQRSASPRQHVASPLQRSASPIEVKKENMEQSYSSPEKRNDDGDNDDDDDDVYTVNGLAEASASESISLAGVAACYEVKNAARNSAKDAVRDKGEVARDSAKAQAIDDGKERKEQENDAADAAVAADSLLLLRRRRMRNN